jgi:hypothetical protein
VEVGTDGQSVLIRDSKRRGQQPLRFDISEFSAFVAGVRNGEFDHLAAGNRHEYL